MLTPIKVGTRFRYSIRDENPLWRVNSRVGKADVYEAITLSETIEVSGKPYTLDGGETGVFRGDEIRNALALDAMWSDLTAESSAKAQTLRNGQIVHYDNGFAQFVRCEVVLKDGEVTLKPLALVGNWQNTEIGIRHLDGSVSRGTYARFLSGDSPDLYGREGETTMTVYPSNIWELKSATEKAYSMRSARPPQPGQTVNLPRYEAPFDPTTVEPISLELPPMTPRESEVARLHRVAQGIIDILGDDNFSLSDEPDHLRKVLTTAGEILETESKWQI